ncbi:tetratricopeptide repeat protein [Candidatus Poribacteria bacterium]|nr:tetratricopeptide repeat protein [Candidatus Poribacteria bacterium]
MHRHAIFLTVLIPLLFITITIADNSHTFAQVQRAPTVQEVHPSLDSVEAAHDHYHERRYTEAIKAYEALLEKGIANPDGSYTPLHQNSKDSIRLMLGQSYAKIGEDAAAQRIFREVIDENPNSSYATQAVHRLANLHWNRYQFREAILQCKQILNQHPGTSAAATAAYLVGQYQQAEGRSEEAVKSYKYFLDNFQTSPYRTTATNRLIQLYITNQRYVEAEKLIQERMQQYPDDINLLEQLAELYQQQDDYPKAFELYQEAIRRHPENTNLRKKLGALYAETGKTEQAVAEWEKLVAGNLKRSDRHQQLGSIYLSHKMYPEAIAAYQQAIQLSPQDSYLYTQLASAYKIQGKIQEAADVYIDALQRIGLGWNQREFIWREMLEIYEGAAHRPLREKLITLLQQQQAQSGYNPNIVMTLGELLFYAGKATQALETFTYLHRSYPAHTDTTLEKYARILERNENLQAATDFYKALIAGSTDRSRVRNTRSKLAALYEKMEQWDAAVTLLKEQLSTGNAVVKDKLLLGRLQLRGLRAPKSAQMTLEPLLTQRLTVTQLTEAQLGLGECHVLLKRYTLAREVLEPIASRTNRFRAPARKLIGDSYFFAGDFEQAIEAYNLVIKISKSDKLTNDALERIVLIQNHPDYFKVPLTDYATAVQLLLSGQTDAALQQCQGTLDVYPEATIVDDVWMLIGNIYSGMDKDNDAINAYEEVIAQESPMAAKALMNIAEVYRENADFANATSTYTTLIADYPQNVIVAHARQQLDALMKGQEK